MFSTTAKPYLYGLRFIILDQVAKLVSDRDQDTFREKQLKDLDQRGTHPTTQLRRTASAYPARRAPPLVNGEEGGSKSRGLIEILLGFDLFAPQDCLWPL